MGDVLVVRNGNILDPESGERGEHHVVIHDGIIREIVPADVAPPSGDRTIDAEGRTVTAGLIDTHLHLSMDGTADTWWEENPRQDVLAMRCYAHARMNLMAGITTVRDLGAPGFAVLGVRDGIEKHGLLGPRIQACGRGIGSTGGHNWNVTIEADGPVGVRRAVREVIKNGADCVKLFGTGFPGVEEEGFAGNHLTPEEIAAAVDEAHERKRKVAIHACNERTVRSAVEAGVDSVEHGLDLSDEVLKMMADRGVAFTPTLACVGTFAGCDIHADRSTFDEFTEGTYELLGRAASLGVPIACGSDSGGTPPATLSWELKAFSDAGLTDLEVLASATTVAAQALGLEDRGVLEPGRLGDLVVWEESFYGAPHRVVIGGREA